MPRVLHQRTESRGWVAPARLWILLTIATAGLGCGKASEVDTEPFARRDSAGITIVESREPRWEESSGWRLAAEPKFVIGSGENSDGGEGGILLDRVVAVQSLSDGRVLLANQGSREVLLFDSLGNHLQTFGGRGEGPGELRRIDNVHVCAGDTIMVRANPDLEVFDSAGRFVRRIRYRPDGVGRRVFGVSRDCQRFVSHEDGKQPPLGKYGLATDVLVWSDASFMAFDTVTESPTAEGRTRRNPSTGGLMFAIPPWGIFWWTMALGRESLVVGFGRAPEVRSYAPDGRLTRIARWRQVAEPVTVRDRVAYMEKRRDYISTKEGLFPPDLKFLFPDLSDVEDIPSHKPLFGELKVDDEGNVWLRRFPSESLGMYDGAAPMEPPPNERWILLGEDGWWLGGIEMPDRFELHSIARGVVYGVHRDSLGIETATAYRILR